MATKSRRIYEIARDFGVSSQALVKVLVELKFNPKSHMSVATPEMIFAINTKFAEEKRTARKEMEEKRRAKARQEHAKKSPPRGAVRRPASASEANKPATTESGSRGAPAARGSQPEQSARPSRFTQLPPDRSRSAKKRRKKEKRKNKERTQLDSAEVGRSFKATMAELSGAKTKKRYERGAGQGEAGEVGDGRTLRVNEFMSVGELSNLMGLKAVEVISKLLELGMMATINQRIDMDTIQMIASEYGFETEAIKEIGEVAQEEEREEFLVHRPPVVTIMGHVDHGKTSLLDYVRKSDVVKGEAGSITQHIGAYQIVHKDQKIVFLDTPGHEAFTAMRARGSQITDIVIVLVAADEGVKPQTIEAIEHSRAAGVPIVVGMSKIDKPNARPDEVRTQLANHNLMAEEWGGKTIVVEFSAKTGDGVDQLLDMLLLQAEMLDLKADPAIRGHGVVVDARLEKGRGPIATVLIQSGKCSIGDPIVAGVHSGRIRLMLDDRNDKLTETSPSSPIQITGLSGVPQAGDSFLVVKNDQDAREITLARGQIKREYEFRRSHGTISLENIFEQIKEGQIKEVRLIIKGDVDGSVEVLSDTLSKVHSDEVKTNIIRRGVGAITESDVLLASASSAIVIGFHVSPDSRAREVARREKVDIREYSIIYEAEADVKKALEGLLAPEITQVVVGMAEVRELFRVPKIGVIAGSYVKEGKISRQNIVRLLRDGTVIYSGKLHSLKRFKDDAKEVKEGFECGIGIENYNDIKVGDLIESLEIVEVARTLS